MTLQFDPARFPYAALAIVEAAGLPAADRQTRQRNTALTPNEAFQRFLRLSAGGARESPKYG